jgi:hypothetical protein
MHALRSISPLTRSLPTTSLNMETSMTMQTNLSNPRKSARVLVVSDDEWTRVSLCDALQRAGHKVMSLATNAAVDREPPFVDGQPAECAVIQRTALGQNGTYASPFWRQERDRRLSQRIRTPKAVERRRRFLPAGF